MLSIAPILINFQPGASPVPSGYIVDSGAAFGARNGLAYGWDAANNKTRDRNSSRSPDQRYDTLNHMQLGKGSRTWEVAVPAGLYNVRVAAGDSNYTDSIYRLDAEGKRIIDGVPNKNKRWFAGLATVGVSDGRLTISNAPGSSNNKINFIEISDAAPGGLTAGVVTSTDDTAAAQLNWTNNAFQASGVRIERSIDGVDYTLLATVSATATSYTDDSVVAGESYSYRVIAASGVALSAASEPAVVAIPLPAAEAAGQFTLYDAMLFQSKPDLSAAGLQPIYVTDREVFAGSYPNYDKSKPDEAATRALARKVAALNQMLVLDIEHWEVNIMYAPVAEVEHNLQMLGQIVDWIKDERPEVKVGFYGILPLADYWITANYAASLLYASTDAWWNAMLPKARAKYETMQAANDFVASFLAAKVDFLCPSFYTFYDDPQGWQAVSTMRIGEAKRFGKPVLPFLWMQYHEGGPVREHTLYLPADYWNLQLETVFAHADGAVIWGGWGGTWDESAPWWQVTSEFLEAVGS